MALATQKPDSLPRALLVRGVEARAGPVNFQLDSDFDDVQELLTARKVATVFEDPTVQASDTKVYSGVAHQGGGTYGTDHEIIVYGTGFNRVVKPILDFDPPLAAAAVDVHVSRTRRLQTLPPPPPPALLLLLLLLLAYCV